MIHKKLGGALAVGVLVAATAGVAHAALSKAYMDIGTGSTFVSVPGDGTWTTFLEVGPVNAPVAISCEVTASWMYTTSGGAATVSIATAPDARGPWVQTGQSTTNGYGSGAMTQGFNVPAGQATTFYVNAADFNGAGIGMQGTRAFVVCRTGAVVGGAEDLGTDDGPSN